MRRVMAAFEKGDLEPLFKAIDEGIVWKTASTRAGDFRFSGEYRNRAGVVEVMSKFAMSYFVRRFAPREILSSGEIVWGLFDVEMTYQPMAENPQWRRPVALECAMRWRVKDGRILEHQAFYDTASMLAQQAESARPS
ncbi:MAG: nuclear transport factor 2 family protein [Alphaproteobacteria bacterium]|jgi:ketosteroid isomerase-like protein|nr:nuclear transport factor 2 family protein [Alphaproteobacteria bacterium]